MASICIIQYKKEYNTCTVNLLDETIKTYSNHCHKTALPKNVVLDSVPVNEHRMVRIEAIDLPFQN